MSTQHWLQYRGQIQAMEAEGSRLLLVTVHPEGRPTALYRLDPVAGHLESQPLPCGGVAIVGGGSDRIWWVAGTDGRLYRGRFGQLAAVGPRFEPQPRALAPLARGGVAVLHGTAVSIVDAEGSELSRLSLCARGTALGTDPSRTWLAVGAMDGTVTVFSSEAASDPLQFTESASAVLHDGPVAVLRFERDELRFRSVGADRRLLLTHARGALQPVERGGRGSHSGPVRAMAGDGPRAYTAGEDGQIKAWPRDSQRAPASMSEGVGKVAALVELPVDGRPHLAAACLDDTVRLFPIQADEDGKLDALSHRVYGAMGRIKRELMLADIGRRRAALDTLAEYDDAAAIEALSERAWSETDHALQVRAVTLLGGSRHPRAAAPLERLLAGPTEAVRRAALAGLLARSGPRDPRIATLALRTDQPDVGVEAVGLLAALAREGSVEAAETLRSALDASADAIRNAALDALEALHPGSAAADLLGLGSKAPSLRWRAALRLLQRGLLGDEVVQRALRAATDDDDADVRQIAYHLRILSVPSLAARLRFEDADLHRNLHALETHGQELAGLPPEAPRPGAPPESLGVLLAAAASRQQDTALRGASHLAALGDGRAFGVLLQLSREGSDVIRVRVCHAFRRLADPRSIGRLRSLLRDAAGPVRDAAFSAIEHLLAPLPAARAGLAASAPDVRRRGLAVLTGLLRTAEASGPERDEMLTAMRQALDDPDLKLRMDAFKAVLALGIGGSAAEALRFSLSSTRADVRREATTELMGEVHHDWAFGMLLERFDDPDPDLRREAFTFVRRKGRDRAQEREILAAALRSRYPDLRLEAIGALAERPDEDSQSLLVEILDDEVEAVRAAAFEVVQRIGAYDAIAAALQSRHPDVHIRAAQSLAGRGRPEALAPLLAQVQRPKPDAPEAARRWREHLLAALDGLALLRDPTAAEPVARLLDEKDAELRRAAAKTLAWTAPAELLAAHRGHADEAVRLAVALGLAWLGDPVGGPIVFQRSTPVGDRLAAALVLGDEEQLVAMLDDRSAEDSAIALSVVLLYEWAGAGFPDLLLTALSCESARVRLVVARILEAWGGPELDHTVLVHTAHAADPRSAPQPSPVGTRRLPPWPVDPAVLRRLALGLRYAERRDRVAAVRVALLLGRTARTTAEAAEAAATLTHQWQLASLRSRGALDALADPGPPPHDPQLASLVFGTYAGLGAVAAAHDGIRASAVGRLARADGDRAARIDAMLPALRDRSGTVRTAAFEGLRRLGLDERTLAAEAIATGARDVGLSGLTLLVGLDGPDALLGPLTERDDGLEIVALELLRDRAGALQAAASALRARSPQARARGVAMLAERYEPAGTDAASRRPSDSEAAVLLRSALDSPHTDVRRAAAEALARLHDPAAFEALVLQLRDPSLQIQAIDLLTTLGDGRAAAALLDRLVDDPEGTAVAERLIRAVGTLREPAVIDRLAALIETHPEHAKLAMTAMLAISGYDQRTVLDLEDPDRDEAWLEGQHPRRDEILARLLQLYLENNDASALARLRTAILWSKSPAVDAPLLRMLRHPTDAIRHLAAEAIAWRARHRGADAAALAPSLSHRDPMTAFLAAEGLALVGRADGIGVLLAAVDALGDLALRRRAVHALGHLEHPRALERLLRIVDEDRHALLDAATAAIGRLGSMPRGPEIFSRLLHLSRGTGAIARQAIVGLRWFGSPDAFARIREAASAPFPAIRAAAVRQLQYDEGPGRAESRAALVRRLLEDNHGEVSAAAALALRGMDGPESLEPDYVFLLAAWSAADAATLERLQTRGDPERLVEAITDPRCKDYAAGVLAAALSVRDPLPIGAALSALRSNRPRGPAIGARLLGHAPSLPSEASGALATASRAALDAWLSERARPAHPERSGRLAMLEDRVRWTLWAAARNGVGGETTAAALQLEGPDAKGIRRAALDALVIQPDPDLLVRVVRSETAAVRTAAAAALVRIRPELAAGLASEVLDDRTTADRVLERGPLPPEALAAAGQLHLQGVVLPHLVARREVGALREALDSPLEAVQLGAVEALGAVPSEAAEAALRAFASDEARREEVRKSAWRALRRCRRERQRLERSP